MFSAMTAAGARHHRNALTAFYTLDLDDALKTGLAMAAERKAAGGCNKGAA
jgi:hypothetical protein